MKKSLKETASGLAQKLTSPFRYGIGMFGTSLAINMFRGRASSFWVDELAALTFDDLALITLIYTFLDVIDNPIYGILSDNTRTKIGRRKPWLLVSAPLFALCFIFFYSPPDLGRNGMFAWALIFYFVAGTLDSMINANYGALFPELFPDDKIRAKTNAIRQVSQLVAMVLGIAVAPVLVQAIGGGTGVEAVRRGYTATAVIFGVVSAAVMLYMAFGVHEPKPELLPKTKILPALLQIAKSRNFWIIGAANAFYSAGMALVMSSIPFYVKYSLGRADGTSQMILMGVVILVAVGGVIVWSTLVRKFGVQKVWAIALIALAIAFIPIYFSQAFWQAILSSVLVGLGFSGVISTMDLMGAKVLDEDYARHGIRREGIISSTMGFMNRLSGLFVSLGMLLVSRIYGFVDGNNTGSNPGEASRFMLAIFPFIVTLIGVAFTFFVKFDDDKIKGDIAKWKEIEAARDAEAIAAKNVAVDLEENVRP